MRGPTHSARSTTGATAISAPRQCLAADQVFGFYFNNRLSYYSAQPASASCGPRPGNLFAPPAGARANGPADRICADGHILVRNTIRKETPTCRGSTRIRPDRDRSRATWKRCGGLQRHNTDNFKDPAAGTFLNFDGTIRSGLGDPRQLQAGLRWVF